ncbi:class I SAM-dependent DNA methyltransferase [Noviherbaspirillum aridicola]|uniref:site-specific DNA-methyltransferase (adenine-specific) n=1 Tax=Noviherbaspirillum aridicola TaxID=2849687 RepID=A0ABQ4Q3X9_9BURK|nr:DNA methyltransferase [Noviherbaspirillum aridicola]GIZ51741.1 methylase [Noviherbaspirillum aridicola]
MPTLTRNEVRRRLALFAKQWAEAKSEKSQAQTFWLRFYECFGIRAESATIYEQSVKRLGGDQGFIDSFIPGKLIVEHKSAGKDLDAAFDQASTYFLALKEAERPRYIITSDFARFRLYDLGSGQRYECTLAELPKKADWFSFLSDESPGEVLEESPINREAAYRISRLHEALLQAKFKGRDLEVFLTRLLFCLFADDTGIFGANGQFRRLVESTRPDGKDLGASLAELFQVLNQPVEERQSSLDEALASFEYINGSLFADNTRIPAFNHELRTLLMECVTLDWSGISPAIFGAMFQGVLEEHEPAESRKASRRELGAHYTSERNILRVIDPLFMDDLRAELEAAKRNKPRLQALYNRLPTLTFFDPACGCGNFLVIAYRELRRLENEVISLLFNRGGQTKGLIDVEHLCRVSVNQFYGIEIDESAAHIARVALWITDHQMNMEAAALFGTTRATVPLVASPTIVCANALRTNWHEVLNAANCDYLFGNPPFVGKKEQTLEQKNDVAPLFRDLKGAGVLDYVCAWYLLAAVYLRSNPGIKAAFVSTNSITQGEQVGVLWSHLLSQGIHIHFAHRTFRWSNEGKANAAVHCVIIGFGLRESANPRIFDYSKDLKGEEAPIVIKAKRINPYLVDAPDVCLTKRTQPLCVVPVMNYGSMPIDDGHLILSPEDRRAFVAESQLNKALIREYMGGDEFINGHKRYCLWLVDAPPAAVKQSRLVMGRLALCRKFRENSGRGTTKNLADYPGLFGEIRQPDSSYLLLPKVSSENREYMPIGFIKPTVIANGSALIVPNARLYHLGILTSAMHMAWMRATCGRLESRYQYSSSIVYNNFPWPDGVTEKQFAEIETRAQDILNARALFPDATLADLYDVNAMPKELRVAHKKLDNAVDAAYRFKGSDNDPARVAYLFEMYQKLASPLVTVATKTKRRAVA